MGRRRKAEEQPLSEYWKPPVDSGPEGGVGEPVACVATTFEFDAGFFEEELLPRFLGLRFDHTENERTFIIEREEALAVTRVMVLVDASKFDPRQTTLQWDQLPIQVPGGVQHAKFVMLVWEHLVRLILASANLTRQGYRRNRELFAALDFFDGPDSVPLKPLRDALDFLDVLYGWSRGLPAATQRVCDTVAQVRAHVQRWSAAPGDFRPRERPRVTLVVGHPAHENGPALSVIDRLAEIWSSRTISKIAVVSPFVGHGADGQDPVLARMRDFRIVRCAEGRLALPKVPVPEGSEGSIVAAPERFGRDWKKLFGGGAYVLPVPGYVEGVDERPRDLHAKAVLISGDRHELLMIGSSNFTPRGMGVNVFNCEANLVFEDWLAARHGGVTLGDRLALPVSWENEVGVDEVAWQAPDGIPEDAPPGSPALPPFFAWAGYSQRTGAIRVGLDHNQAEPLAWSIGLAGQSTEHEAVLFSKETIPPGATVLSFILEEKARGAHITALRVDWKSEEELQHEAFLAVSVEDREADLLPPAEFRNLTVETIIECLLSGREPAEWIKRQRHGRRKRSDSTSAAIESLRAVDTSNYVLYRVRRFGRGLAAMSERISRTTPRPDAIRYMLLRDPLGPIQLAETMCRQQPAGGGESPEPMETDYRLYALAEIALSLGYVGRHLLRKSGPNGGWLKPLFVDACDRLSTLAKEVRSEARTSTDDLLRYLDAAFSEAGRLLDEEKEK